MDDTTDYDSCARESLNGKNSPTSEELGKDTSSPRNSIPKVSLKLPFKSENFRAQSLLARFHSSRKSESGIRNDVKPSNNALWAGFTRNGSRSKTDSPYEGTSSPHSSRENTSASLPDDLDQNTDVGDSLSGTKEDLITPDGNCDDHEDAERPDATSLSSEETSFLPSPGQKGMESWFGTWPGRPKKLKGLKKKLISGTNLKDTELEDTTQKGRSSDEVSDISCDDVFRDSCVSVKGSESEMNTKVVNGSPHVTLDALLESLPLVYNPATKQLCLSTSRKTLKGSTNKRMSSSTPPNIWEDSRPEKLKCDEESEFSKFEDRDDESQQDALLKATDLCDASASPKTLEIIQEVDESGECLRLIDSNPSPHSGNVSGSSSLERGYFESPRNSLQRVGTNNSLSITDASSFSSLSSSNTELSAYSATDSAVCLGSHLSDTGSLRDFSITDGDGKTKRRGITDFLTRNLFSWRHKEGSTGSGSDGSSSTSSSPAPPSPASPSSSSTAWKIFSRPSPRPPRSPDLQARNCELEAGSVGLIMENRPTNLPAKTTHEQLKHKQEYQAMVSAAKKKELREAKERKKAQASQQKLEEQMAAAVATWTSDILPKWDTMHTHKKCRELWWQGLPSCVRGKVWKLAIGNELNITPQLYNIMVQRSVDKLLSLSDCGSTASQEDVRSDSEDQEGTIDLIRLDVSRTFPHLCIFQKGGPYHDPLHNILGAYACYRPDVGYVQGMSFLAATLLLNMDETDAFIAFSNLLNRQAHMAFFRVDQPVMCVYYKTFEELLAVNLPNLADHLRNIQVTPDLYILDWLLTVFARPLPIDAAVRLWDVYLRDGEEFLIRAAIGILKLYESVLTNLDCTVTAAQFLTRLPDDLCAEALFRAIASVRTSAHKRAFAQILQAHMDAMAANTV